MAPELGILAPQRRRAPRGCELQAILGSAELRQSAGKAWAVQSCITRSVQPLLRAAAESRARHGVSTSQRTLFVTNVTIDFGRHPSKGTKVSVQSWKSTKLFSGLVRTS